MKTLYWKIKDFLSREAVGQTVESPIFSLTKPFENEFSQIERLQLQVYSKGPGREAARPLKVYLLNKSDFDLEIRYTLFFIKKDGSKYTIPEDDSDDFFNKGEVWEHTTSIKVAELENKGFLHIRDLLIGATICYGKGKSNQGHC